jgi:hypothetical protein
MAWHLEEKPGIIQVLGVQDVKYLDAMKDLKGNEHTYLEIIQLTFVVCIHMKYGSHS